MRNISAGGLALLATKEWEPLIILEIDWAGNNAPISYSDRNVEGIKGRILEVGDLDNIINIESSNSQQISVTLDDTDGTIKAILDQYDVHQRNVSVYQFFDGLDLSDKFLLFQGKITSPIVWSEGDRTVSLNVEAQLEDKEFGFSAEEGQFPFIPKDMIGQAWPSIFGKVLDVPALQVNKAVSGSTLCGIGIVSGRQQQASVPLGGNNCGLMSSLSEMSNHHIFLEEVASAWDRGSGRQAAAQAASYRKQAQDIMKQMSDAIASFNQQQSCGQQVRAAKLDAAEHQGTGCNPVRILGGEDFPQSTPITINVGGGLFTGIMRNDSFSISSRRHPENEQAAKDALNAVGPAQCPQATFKEFSFEAPVPCGQGDDNFKNSCKMSRDGFVLCEESSSPTTPQVAQHFWAEPGSRVVLNSDEPITYIVSITPGTVLAVKAYKDLNGEKRLVNVPNDLWRVQTVNYGPVTAVQIVVNKPLSTIVDQGWGDELYVTFESTIGPSTVEILQYIIDNYTDLTYDATSFNYVETKLAPFPMNFAVLDRENTIDLIKKIAFVARCAVWIDNGVFHLKYLPEEPASDSTITVSDIQNKSIEVELTPTEDLVTKMVVTWKLSWANGNGEVPNKIILRHNVNKYGTKEQEFDFSYYNQPDIILKAATFWLIRKANTWKKIKFKTFLHKLNLETFDTVTLDLPPYVANGDVKAMVEKANYNSADQMIDFECWVPVKSGTMEKYKFAWPSALTVSDTFPTPAEIAAGNAGGAGIGAGATGQLPVGYTGVIGVPGKPIFWQGAYDNGTTYAVNDAVSYNGSSYVCYVRTVGHDPTNKSFWKLVTVNGQQGGTVFVGGPNVIFGPGSDRGDRRPGDAGFLAQTIIPATVYAQLLNSRNPNPDLRLNYLSPLPPLQTPSSLAPVTQIDIRKTEIIDSDEQNSLPGFLSSLIRQVGPDGILYLRQRLPISDGQDTLGRLALRYDSDSQQFAPTRAFLADKDADGKDSQDNSSGANP